MKGEPLREELVSFFCQAENQGYPHSKQDQWMKSYLGRDLLVNHVCHLPVTLSNEVCSDYKKSGQGYGDILAGCSPGYG